MKLKVVLRKSILALLFVSASCAADMTARQLNQFYNNCLQCHARPNIGAPMIGDSAKWRAVLEQGERRTLINVVEGINSMPPLGYCSSCDEDDFLAMIRFITGSASKE
ncbi:hypothetical protein D9M68_491990 [compost metagenome]